MRIRLRVLTVLALFLSQVNAAEAQSNRAPTISGTPPASVIARETYHFMPSARDPEGRRLTFSVRNKPDWAAFSKQTGRLTGAPGISHVGTHRNIVISVSDGRHTTSLPAFSILIRQPDAGGTTDRPPVVSARGNRPPVISGVAPTTAIARTTYEFLPTASDPERRRLTFSVTNQPPWTAFSKQTGRLTGAPGVSHIGTTYPNIVISVSDGHSRASLPAFSITVQAAGSQHAANRPPVVSGSPPGSATVGSPYSFTPTGSDPDGDTLTWSITNKPSAANFSVTSGRLSWTPTSAGNWSNIVIKATDSKGASASLPAFSITATTSTPSTGSAALSWQAPTQYTNGSSLSASSITAYRIYRGSSAGSLGRIAEVDGRTTQFSVQDLPRGTHYFAVTAVTTAGAESGFSAIGSKTIP